MDKIDNNVPSFGFLALPYMTIPTTNIIELALGKFLPSDAIIADLSIDNEAVTFRVDGRLAMIAYADFPIPWSDLEGPCAASWLWQDATEQMKKHKAHLIVTLSSDKGTQLERTLLLTRLLAATSEAFNAIGVYWGHGSVVLSAELYREITAEASIDNLPLLAWIEFRVEKNKNGTLNVLTTGLDYFGRMEIEVLDSRRSFEEIMNTVMGISTITLRGDVIKDGDTVGPDAQTKIRVRHKKSHWDRKGTVLNVEI